MTKLKKLLLLIQLCKYIRGVLETGNFGNEIIQIDKKKLLSVEKLILRDHHHDISTIRFTDPLNFINLKSIGIKI